MNKWSSDNGLCQGTVETNSEGEYIVKGYIQNFLPNTKIYYWAANPPDYITSYSGSGLPFPNPETAFENTPNRGIAKVNSGMFQFRIQYPNAFYVNLGTLYIEPTVYFKICGTDKIHTIPLGNGIPFRMLTYPPSQRNTAARTNSLFYKGRDDLPIRTQEQILRDSGYPDKNVMPSNFWGLSIPHP